MSTIKVIFMGSPKFAVESLKKIIESKYKVVAIVTSPDKPAGRRQKITFSCIKHFALSLNIPILQPKILNSKIFITQLYKYQADIFIVVGFKYLPENIWKLPPYGTINLHASLLPNYRGPAPINYALINGEKTTGVTTILINNQIDTGNILLQKSLDIDPQDNAGTLHNKLMVLGANLLIKTIDKILKKSIIPSQQIDKNSDKLSYKILKKHCKIDWFQPSYKINNLIRGLAPHPGAFTLININNIKKYFKIYEGSYMLCKHNVNPGATCFIKNKLKIYTQDGIYFPELVQLEAKKKMNISNFLNGIKNKINKIIIN